MPAGNTSRPTMNRITERVKGGGRRGERILSERHWGVWVPCHIVCVPIVSQVKSCSMKFWWHYTAIVDIINVNSTLGSP